MPEIDVNDRETMRNYIRDILLELVVEDEAFDDADDDGVYISEEQEADELGLIKLADFFTETSCFLRELDELLEFQGYELTTAGAYSVLGDLLSTAIEYGWLQGEDWGEIIDRFAERADLFVNDDKPVPIPLLHFTPETASNIYNLFFRHWVPDYSPLIDDLPIHMKIARIRGVVYFLRDYRIVDPKWEWVGKLAKDLDVLYKIYRPVPAPPSGSTPYSRPGQ